MVEDFLRDSLLIEDEPALVGRYLREMEKLGYDRVIMALLTEHRFLKDRKPHPFCHNFPDGWLEHYYEGNQHQHDPVRAHIFHASDAFLWNDLRAITPLKTKQKKFLHELEAAGLHHGIAIPLRAARGALAAIGAASGNPEAALPPETVTTAKLVTMQFYDRFLNLCSDHGAKKTITLSNRERQFLQWTAQGKTRSEIAAILGLSTHTVNIYAANILKKFNTNNMVVAVFSALEQGLIQLSS